MDERRGVRRCVRKSLIGSLTGQRAGMASCVAVRYFAGYALSLCQAVHRASTPLVGREDLSSFDCDRMRVPLYTSTFCFSVIASRDLSWLRARSDR